MAEPARPLHLLSGAAVLLGAALMLRRAWLPVDAIIGTTADDMFYYLEIARNLAEGQGPTFDGATPTNGWHPLWMLLLVLLRLLSGGGDALQVHLALSLLVLATAAAGVALSATAARLSGPSAGALVAALWMLHPWTAQITLSGVEAPLATAALALSLWLSLDGRTAGGALRLGAAMGLACLARTDSVLICTALGLATYGALLLRQPREAAGLIGRCLAAGSALLLPWLAWNQLTFGRISQDSARAIASLRHERYFQRHSAGDFLHSVPRRLGQWLDALGALWGLPGALVLAAILGALGAAALLHRRREPAARLWAAAAGGLLLVGSVYALYFWYIQRWYLLSSLMLTCLLLALALGRALSALTPQARRPLIAAGAAALIGAASLPGQARLEREGTWPWQAVYYELSQRLDRLPPGSRVGAFNAGIYGYFAEVSVVNLDGVVNGEALAAMQRDALLAYVREQSITHIVDHEEAFGWFMEHAEPEWADAFQLHGRFPSGSSGGDVLLTAVKPSAPRPPP